MIKGGKEREGERERKKEKSRLIYEERNIVLLMKRPLDGKFAFTMHDNQALIV